MVKRDIYTRIIPSFSSKERDTERLISSLEGRKIPARLQQRIDQAKIQAEQAKEKTESPVGDVSGLNRQQTAVRNVLQQRQIQNVTRHYTRQADTAKASVLSDLNSEIERMESRIQSAKEEADKWRDRYRNAKNEREEERYDKNYDQAINEKISFERALGKLKSELNKYLEITDVFHIAGIGSDWGHDVVNYARDVQRAEYRYEQDRDKQRRDFEKQKQTDEFKELQKQFGLSSNITLSQYNTWAKEMNQTGIYDSVKGVFYPTTNKNFVPVGSNVSDLSYTTKGSVVAYEKQAAQKVTVQPLQVKTPVYGPQLPSKTDDLRPILDQYLPQSTPPGMSYVPGTTKIEVPKISESAKIPTDFRIDSPVSIPPIDIDFPKLTTKEVKKIQKELKTSESIEQLQKILSKNLTAEQIRELNAPSPSPEIIQMAQRAIEEVEHQKKFIDEAKPRLTPGLQSDGSIVRKVGDITIRERKGFTSQVEFEYPEVNLEEKRANEIILKFNGNQEALFKYFERTPVEKVVSWILPQATEKMSKEYGDAVRKLAIERVVDYTGVVKANNLINPETKKIMQKYENTTNNVIKQYEAGVIDEEKAKELLNQYYSDADSSFNLLETAAQKIIDDNQKSMQLRIDKAGWRIDLASSISRTAKSLVIVAGTIVAAHTMIPVVLAGSTAPSAAATAMKYAAPVLKTYYGGVVAYQTGTAIRQSYNLTKAGRLNRYTFSSTVLPLAETATIYLVARGLNEIITRDHIASMKRMRIEYNPSKFSEDMNLLDRVYSPENMKRGYAEIKDGPYKYRIITKESAYLIYKSAHEQRIQGTFLRQRVVGINNEQRVKLGSSLQKKVNALFDNKYVYGSDGKLYHLDDLDARTREMFLSTFKDKNLKGPIIIQEEGISKIRSDLVLKITGETVSSKEMYSVNGIVDGRRIEFMFTTTSTDKIQNLYVVNKILVDQKGVYLAYLGKVIKTPRVTKFPIEGGLYPAVANSISVKPTGQVFLITGETTYLKTFSYDSVVMDLTKTNININEILRGIPQKEMSLSKFIDLQANLNFEKLAKLGLVTKGTMSAASFRIDRGVPLPSMYLEEPQATIYTSSTTTDLPRKGVPTFVDDRGSPEKLFRDILKDVEKKNPIISGKDKIFSVDASGNIISGSAGKSGTIQYRTAPLINLQQIRGLITPNLFNTNLPLKLAPINIPDTSSFAYTLSHLSIGLNQITRTVNTKIAGLYAKMNTASTLAESRTATQEIRNNAIRQLNEIPSELSQLESDLQSDYRILNNVSNRVQKEEVETIKEQIDTQKEIERRLREELARTKVVQDSINRQQMLLRQQALMRYIQMLIASQNALKEKMKVLRVEQELALKRRTLQTKTQLKAAQLNLKNLNKLVKINLNNLANLKNFGGLDIDLDGLSEKEAKNKGKKPKLTFTQGHSYVKEFRRKGKWVRGTKRYLTYGEAVADGVSKTAKTLAASFRIKKVAQKPNSKISNFDVSVAIELLKRRYYRSTKEEGVWIERKGYRLSTKTEIEEIHKAKKEAETHRMFWFGR